MIKTAREPLANIIDYLETFDHVKKLKSLLGSSAYIQYIKAEGKLLRDEWIDVRNQEKNTQRTPFTFYSKVSYGENYYTFTTTGIVFKCTNWNTKVDRERNSLNLCFPDPETAKQYYQIIRSHMRRFKVKKQKV